ncbi:endonuclease I family protein [Brumimicrobium aurantiacum]|uniref:Ribonuclease n=1 Tax=Brumimicrobium aurantiacum TaxID=1737063 RepID=A0A3E1EZB3_9FLAO|nr:endonuclease [Brumimicrobium aurantiacum]RFC54894.1 ribonuclease [Brumimicrobium aurantiacum]
MKKRIYTRLLMATVLTMSIQTLFAQIPTGYYDTANGLTGTALKSALNNIIKGHTTFPYSSGGTDVWDMLKETDKDPSNPNNVILIYTGASVNGDQEYNNGNGWNREHVWAKSHGDFGNSQGPGTDAHHLRPSNIQVNGDRGNKWFGNCSTPHTYNGSATGNFYNNSLHLWKPRDEVKGDIARMIFYMATRYEGQNGEPDLEVIDYLPSNNSTTDPVHALLSDLLAWHNEDPVNDWERNRNDVIYYDFQNNRNPFIDHPDYANLIWGDTTTTSVDLWKKEEPKELLKVIDMTGREVKPMPNSILIYIYSDGTREKRVLTD